MILNLHFTKTANQLDPDHDVLGDYDEEHLHSCPVQMVHANPGAVLGARADQAFDGLLYFIGADLEDVDISVNWTLWDKMVRSMSMFFLSTSPSAAFHNEGGRFDGLAFRHLVAANYSGISLLTPAAVRVVASDFLNVQESGEEEEYLDFMNGMMPSDSVEYLYGYFKDAIITCANQGGLMHLS